MKQKFREKTDDSGKVIALETSNTGKYLLSIPELNKATAFSPEERLSLALLGKIPEHVETLDSQIDRYYQQFLTIPTALGKNRFLNSIKQYNNIAFYKLVTEHLHEMMPIIYTPTIGDAVKSYSYQFNLSSGITFPSPKRIISERSSTTSPTRNWTCSSFLTGKAYWVSVTGV